MRKALSVLIVLMLCLSCTKQKSMDMLIYGVSFTCPAGWEVTDTGHDGTTAYVCIEKKGFSSSGLVVMSFTDEDFELDKYLRLTQESFKEHHAFTGIVFQPAVEANYGKYKGIASAYTFKIGTLKHEGKIHVFQENGITMALVHQEAIEDHQKNLSGFEIIEESLSF